MSTQAVGVVAPSPVKGIVAPKPSALIGVEPRAKVLVCPGEPVYIFLPLTMGAGRSIGKLNKRTPFLVTAIAQPPAGVDRPRELGSWFKVELKEGAKVGAVDRVAVMVTPVVPHPSSRVEHYFTLIVGSQRYY